jgi:patatin-related protein
MPSHQSQGGGEDPAHSAEPAAKAVEPEVEEVRLAMALNGGVSLAVWMGGCAVELDRARRANSAESGERRIYDALCECFGRRLVLDILTGASAGGINGALLSAAMVSGKPLTAKGLRDRWLDLGDLAKLLHDANDEQPRALLKGDLFHEQLKATFEEFVGRIPNEGDKDVPSLDVTMTDVNGVEKRFVDAWGGELLALEHRPRFKFRERSHFTAEALATAARTSASFPFAFEPVRVEGDARILAGLPHWTYGIDGGLLDNAPIRAALDLIPTKSAGSRVRRYVCYLNGDPPQRLPEMIDSREPGLREVGMYTVNLPRTAPFVDQLYAIQQAVERPRRAGEVQRQLLRLPLDCLTSVAEALLETYRERRTIQSLEELLAEPGDATSVDALLKDTKGFLPWIPFNLQRPREPKDWRWGVRPAQRILHLLLDLLRPPIREAKPGEIRTHLLEQRRRIDEALLALGDARDHVTAHESRRDPSRFKEETPIERLQKSVSKATIRAPTVQGEIEAGVDAFFEALRENEDSFRDSLGDPGDDPDRPRLDLTEALFGERSAKPAPSERMRDHFYRRVLSIEVVRRAFSAEADIDSAQELRFVQLTPASPSPIFTESPLSLPSPASADEKLTGVGLGHFAGFYRRSWRANDFMWGRLDAAARIVDLLLDSPSAEVGREAGADRDARIEDRAGFLASALIEQSPKWLIEEALDDAAGGEEEKAAKDDPGQEARLRAKIEAELELSEGKRGLGRMPFTRAVFQRAAQFEIAAEELPLIREQSETDREIGSAAEPLRLGRRPGDAEAEIKAVREIYDRMPDEGPNSLPRALTDPEEALSDLGLRTITHAAFVGLSAVRNAGVPFSKLFGLVRTPLLAIAGTVAESWIARALVMLGFWATAILLTSRLVGAEDANPAFSEAWSLATLAALVAALGALGTAAVPGLRALRGVDGVRNGLLALVLVGVVGGFTAALAWIFGPLDSVERLLFAPGADNPPEWVLGLSLFLLGVSSAARLPLPGWLGKLAAKLRGGRWFVLLLSAAFVLVGVFAGIDLIDAFDKGCWQKAGIVLGGAVAPLVAAYWLRPWNQYRLQRQAKARGETEERA